MRNDRCTVTRIMLVHHTTIDQVTGKHVETGKEWMVGPCGSPLWSPFEKASGRCAMCRTGWQCETNLRAGKRRGR